MKDAILPLVWVGIYKSVPEALSDSLINIMLYQKVLDDKELQRKRVNILGLDTVKLSG